MKKFRLLNSDDGMIVDEVESRNCNYCRSAFIYKDEKLIYRLIDENTGLAIASARTLKALEEAYKSRKETYDYYRTTDAYKIKVERFEKLKLVHNYKGVR